MANILIIDDEIPARRILGRILEKRGHRLYEASDGAEGLRLVAEQAIDLVITDLLMPEIDGIETILELRRSHATVKIIAISGGGDYRCGTDFLRAASALGADRVFQKPFSSGNLIPAVQELL